MENRNIDPEMKCTAAGCFNTTCKEKKERNIWFYEFPKDQDLRQQWIRKCGKGDDFISDHCYICSEHFTEDDFEPLQTLESSHRKLVSTAVPSLKLQSEIKVSEIEHKGGMTKGLNNNLLTSYKSLLNEYKIMVKTNNKVKKELISFERSMCDKIRQIKKLEKDVTDLQSQLDTEKIQNAKFQKALKYFIEGARRYFVVNQKTSGEWHRDAFIRTLAIRYSSEKCYSYLRENLVYFVPDLPTLQQWMMNINLRQGVLDEVLRIMDIVAGDLTENEKIIVLQFGELKVESLYEYDNVKDEVVGPHAYMQVVMAAALFAKWKQPIYLSFDTKMSKNILTELIKRLHHMSYNVVACISDHNEGTHNLCKEMTLTATYSYFRHPLTEKKIYFFVEASQLLLTIRDILLNEGFVFNTGRKVSAEPLWHLVNSNHNSISARHLQCIGEDPAYSLKLASQLFCYDTAVHLKRLPHNELAYSTGVFIENISKWYALSRQTYGTNLQEHNLTLTNTSNMLSKLVVDKNEKVKILRDMILMSINSLQSLPLDLWGRYNSIYNISTEKLSINELCHLFSEIGGEKCLTDLMSPLKVVSQLRMIISGRTQNTQKNMGDYLTQKVLSSIILPENQVELKHDCFASLGISHGNASQITSTEHDEVHYLVAAMAQEFIFIYPQLGTIAGNITPSPAGKILVDKVIVEPSEAWSIQAIQQLNEVFENFHERGLVTGQPQLTDQLLNVVKMLYPDINLEVAKRFLEQRLMLRMKFLNAKNDKSGKYP